MKNIYTIHEIQEKIKLILDDYDVKKAILFGSYAKGCQTEKSDIDLVVDSEGKLLNINFYGLLEDLVENFGKRIDLFEISEVEKESPLYRNIFNEGVIVYER